MVRRLSPRLVLIVVQDGRLAYPTWGPLLECQLPISRAAERLMYSLRTALRDVLS
jgi:hypothetical protein